MSKPIEGMIECPFYLKEGKSFIKCEGVIGGTVCVQKFKDNIKKTEYERCFCSESGGRKCEHHRMISILYETGLRT